MCLEEAHQAGLAGLSRANLHEFEPKASIKFQRSKRKQAQVEEEEEEEEEEEAEDDEFEAGPASKKPRVSKTHREEEEPSYEGYEGDVEVNGKKRKHRPAKSDSQIKNNKVASNLRKQKTIYPALKRVRLEDEGNEGNSNTENAGKRAVDSREGKKGPQPMSVEQREAQQAKINKKRRESYRAKPVEFTDLEQMNLAAFIKSGLTRHAQRLHAVSTALAQEPLTEAVLAMDTVMRKASSLAAAPPDEAFTNSMAPLAELIHGLADDPLHFDPDFWVQKKLLQEDTAQILVPAKVARIYLRVATIPALHVAEFLENRMVRRPADIPYLAILALCHGLGISETQRMVTVACNRYRLPFAAEQINEAIAQLQLPTRFQKKMSSMKPLTVVYAGVTIEGTPGSRLYDDLFFGQWSHFVNFGKKLRWRVFWLSLADTPAPNGVLSFRTNPRISRWEALLVNALCGLGMNTTEGGSWVSCFQPSAETSLLIDSARLPLPTLDTITGLDLNRCRMLDDLLDSEHQFWPQDDVCVPETLQSIKDNLIDAAWTVGDTVVMLTLAEDITEEERTGRIAGIESDTAGPAMKEAAHSLALLYPQSDLTDVQQMRLLRGPFADIFRMQEVVQRAQHLALLSRLLTVMDPVLIVGWSNTVHHAFYRSELRNVFTGPKDVISAFFAGDTNLAPQVVPPSWYHATMETVSGVYIDAIGIPFIGFHGPDPTQINLYLPQLHAGAAKHDPLTGSEQREMFHLVNGGVVQPAKALIAADVLSNGPIEPQHRQDRLVRLLEQIREHMRKTGVDVALKSLKSQYRAIRAAAAQLRSLHYRVVGDADDDSTCPEEAEEEVDSEDELRKVAPRRSIYAAVGLEARKEQLAMFEADAELARLHGRPEDPFHIAPYKKPIGSPEFAAFILRADDGKDLVRRAASQGGSEGAIVRIADNFAAFELWKKDKAAARRVPDAAGVTPQMHTERQARHKILTAALASFADPRTLENHEFTEALRWFVCSRCSEVVLATSKNSKHCCGAGSEGVKITLESSPNQRRLVFIHDVLHNRQLLTILGQSPGFVPDGVVARTVDEVFADEANVIQLKSALPLDHARLQYKGVETMVYLPVALVDNSYLWVTLAVDVLLRDQCVPKLEPHTAEQLDFWRNSNDTLTTWAADRFLGKSHDKPLYIFKCRRGGFAVTTSIRSRLERPQYFLHDCAYTVDEYKKPEVAAARPKNPDQKANGPRSCPDQEIEPVGCLLELPPTHARVVWAIERLPNLVRISRSKAKEGGGEKAKKKGKKENAEMEDEGKEPTVKKRKEKKAKAGDGKGKGKEVEEVKVKTVKKRKVGQPKVGGNVAGPSNEN